MRPVGSTAFIAAVTAVVALLGAPLAVGQPAAVGAPAATAPTAGAAQQPAGTPVCEACHGPGGNSLVATMPSIAGQPKVFIENQLVLIREGLRDVPAMTAVVKGMSDDEFVALARHYAAQAPVARAGTVDPARQRAGAELSKGMLCGTCHLPGYVGQNQVPRLAGQQETYLLGSLREFRDNPGPGRDTIMSGVVRGTSDADLANLSHYLAHYKGAGASR